MLLTNECHSENYSVQETDKGFEIFYAGMPSGDDPFETEQDAWDAIDWFIYTDSIDVMELERVN